MIENVYVTYEVTVSDKDYYGGKEGTAKIQVSVPLDMLENLNPGDFFAACQKSAVAKFVNPEKE